MKRLLTFVAMLLVVVSVSAQQQAKYIFLFIGDGMGINHIYGTELYNAAIHPEMENNGRVSFSRFPVRTFVSNHSSSSSTPKVWFSSENIIKLRLSYVGRSVLHPNSTRAMPMIAKCFIFIV